MAQRTQYQGFVEPLEQTTLTPVTDMRWFQPASQRPRQPPSRQPALQAGNEYTRPILTSITDNVALWWQPTSEPVRLPRSRFVSQIAGRDSIGTLEPTAFTSPPALSWFQPASEPVRSLPPPLSVDWIVCPNPHEVIPAPPTPLSWFALPSEPVREKHKPRPVDWTVIAPVYETLPAAPPAVSWYQPASIPARLRPRLVQEVRIVAPLEPTRILAPGVASWFVQATEPVREAAQPVAVGFVNFQLDFAVAGIPIDGWYRQQPGPRWEKVGTVNRQGGAFVAHPDNLFVSFDKWFQPPSIPVRKLPPRPEGGAVETPFASHYVTAIAWQVQTSEPIRTVARTVPEGFSQWELDFSKVIPTVDGWHRQHPGPVLAPRRSPPGEASYVAQPSLFTITLDQWHQQASEPIRRRPSRIDAGAVSPPIYVTLPDVAWFVPTSEPQRQKRRLVAEQFAIINVSSVVPHEWHQPTARPVFTVPQPQRPAEFFLPFEPAYVTLDKWHAAPSEPVRVAPKRLPGLWVGVLEPSLATSPPDLSWYQPATEPVRTVRRVAHSFTVVVFDRPVAAVYGFVVAGQVWTPHVAEGELFTPHAVKGQVWTPHSQAGEIE